ncbi:MAG: ATP phosphoribosyltransferase regulatory subunit [Rhodospirillales bacterium]|nr:ATP phosphoribosyltransferase regulatory subunit [Rhodospirillales bacterium]
MNEPINKALLPAGLSDLLPPAAAHEARVVEQVMAAFDARGYERVKPPLIEFEENLIADSGAATAFQMFRLMDPVSQRMMGLRPDMTVQVGRIATTRLQGATRPLRLGYAGQVLRVKGSQLRPERQFGQIGAELIGSTSPAGDAEIILMAYEALHTIGIEGLSVDLGLPVLVSSICDSAGISGNNADTLRAALDRKDAAAVSATGGESARIFSALLEAAGPADNALRIIAGLDLPAAARAEWKRLVSVVEQVKAEAPDLILTIDPVENRGYEYHTGVTFTFFALSVRGELGRGGRYPAGEAGEPATGVTLFTDTIMRALPNAERERRVYLPHGSEARDGAKLRADGWRTVSELENTPETQEHKTRARALNCTHLLEGGSPRPLDE